MLIEIKEYLSSKKSANLQELSLYFRQQPETMRCMLAHWIRKGSVCKAVKPAGCANCPQRCWSAMTEVYEWVS